MLIKRIVTSIVALMLTVGTALAGSAPALALGPGALGVINASGGTSSTDGLKVEMAFGQIQVVRLGSGQFFGPNDPPSASDPERLSNYFVVALDTVGGTTFVGDSYDLPGSAAWDSFTSDVTTTDGGRSGTIVNQLVSGSGGTQVTLDVTLSYTFPNDFINIDAALTLGGDLASTPHRIYWFADSYFNASDDGYSFSTLNSNSKRVAGVTDLEVTAFQAYRETTTDLNWWAGQYACPYQAGSNPGDCTPDTNGSYIPDENDFPNAVSSIVTDNGLGVSSDTAAGPQTINFDLIFTVCGSLTAKALSGVCPPDGSGTLPATGLDTYRLSLIGLGLLALGFYAAAISSSGRRRARQTFFSR